MDDTVGQLQAGGPVGDQNDRALARQFVTLLDKTLFALRLIGLPKKPFSTASSGYQI